MKPKQLNGLKTAMRVLALVAVEKDGKFYLKQEGRRA